MNVADAMTPRESVVTVTVPGTREDVLEYLQERRFSSVPVVAETDDGEQYRGLVSRDSLIEQPDEDQLALLADDVPTVTADASIRHAAEVMVSEGARRLPVVDGRLEGIVTVTDVVHAIATGDVAVEATVGDVFTSAINCVYAGTPLPVAERELSHADVPYAVVLGDDGEMAGMFTEVDVLDVAKVVEGEAETGDSMAGDDSDWKWESIKAIGSTYLPTRNVELPSGPVSEFMTADVETVARSATVQSVAQTMIDEDIEQLPVVSGDSLVGVVRDLDLLKAL